MRITNIDSVMSVAERDLFAAPERTKDIINATWHEMVAYRALWASVLRNAIDDILYVRKHRNSTVSYHNSKHIHQAEKNRYQAKFWIKNRKDNGPGSFIWVCDALGLEADVVRDKILAMSQANAVANA